MKTTDMSTTEFVEELEVAEVVVVTAAPRETKTVIAPVTTESKFLNERMRISFAMRGLIRIRMGKMLERKWFENG